MFNFDLKALREAMAQQQGTGMGLPPMNNVPLTVRPPQIPDPQPDVFAAQRQPEGGGGVQQFKDQIPPGIAVTPRPKGGTNGQSGLEQYKATGEPQSISANNLYEQRIAGLMDRGMSREQAEGNQRHAISMGKDLNGDGVVTPQEWQSNYTSTANPEVADQYNGAENNNTSIYFDATQREDANGMSQQQGFEMIKNANDELLPEGESWGFSDNRQGGPYGGPALYESDEWINNIDYNAGKSGRTIGALTGRGNGSLSGRKGTGSMGDINPNTGQPIVWTEGSVQEGVKLGEIVETPAGRYMVVNGANGQLALKGLEGAAHGGGNYFFNMVNKGHHVGINPKTGDVWYQGAPEVLAAEERSSAAGGDFWTAFQGGPDDDGVWDDQRREDFYNHGSQPVAQAPTWGHVDDWGKKEDRGPVWGSGLFSNETALMRRAVVDNLEKKLLG